MLSTRRYQDAFTCLATDSFRHVYCKLIVITCYPQPCLCQQVVTGLQMTSGKKPLKLTTCNKTVTFLAANYTCKSLVSKSTSNAHACAAIVHLYNMARLLSTCRTLHCPWIPMCSVHCSVLVTPVCDEPLVVQMKQNMPCPGNRILIISVLLKS